MASQDPVTALDFFGSIKPWGRLVYDQIIIVSVVSLLGVLFMFPVLTIGPVCLAAVITISRSVHHRTEMDSISDRKLTRMFLSEIRANFRRGLLFSGLIILSVTITVVYFTLALASDSFVFWVGAAFGFYTFLAIVLLMFRTGYVLSRSTEDLGIIDAALNGIAVAKYAPGYSAIQYLFSGLVLVVMIALPIFGMVLLVGSLALLEITAYETIENDGVERFLDVGTDAEAEE
ncbi:hypothetical protein [Natranaeroarchaeum aerophilus]|uniref:DUF624 domain-containing protein n=1 Tax=Natranaeroarchaeum aerophilus TaxID=2917711 RepID=A0AAE3FSU7_9EURY|nr:hypothetical protein [Natranaeroarchaeum aerophilus]MCL9814952.1 hypothetical protein [Natranaeroarchaeum aerophilus]